MPRVFPVAYAELPACGVAATWRVTRSEARLRERGWVRRKLVAFRLRESARRAVADAPASAGASARQTYTNWF